MRSWNEHLRRDRKGDTWIGRAWTVPRERTRPVHDRAGAFIENVSAVQNFSGLRLLLSEAAAALGFQYFAMIDHADSRKAGCQPIRIHNYPSELERFHDRQHLACSDPVHRACQRTALGFTWSALPTLIRLTPRDQRVLDAAADEGVGEGFTVPVHVPGEFSGSCSFATAMGVGLQADSLAAAQLVGAFAFEAARRLIGRPENSTGSHIHLSDRERECLVWIARGKCDSDIATILGISTHTVNQYVKHARAIFDVVTRAQLVARALLTGTISFLEIARG